jgi:hypothetical protein
MEFRVVFQFGGTIQFVAALCLSAAGGDTSTSANGEIACREDGV